MRTYPECLLGPFTVADDDGLWTSHGADVSQSGATTDGDGRHGKVLIRQTLESFTKIRLSFKVDLTVPHLIIGKAHVLQIKSSAKLLQLYSLTQVARCGILEFIF